MKRARKGSGTIYHRASDGRWAATVDVTPAGSSHRRRRVFYGRSRAEVAAKLRAAMDDGATRRGSYDARPLIDALDAWLAASRPAWKASTRETHESAVRVHIIPLIGSVRLSSLDSGRIADFVAEMRRGGCGPATIAKTFRTLRRALSFAVGRGWIASNPARDLDRALKPSYMPPEKDVLSLHQIAVLFEHLRGTRDAALVLTAGLTGARQAELLGLRWSDVDLRRRTMDISHSLVLVGTEFVEGRPKTRRSSRIVGLPRQVVDALREHRTMLVAENREHARSHGGTHLLHDLERGLVFPSRAGTPIRRQNLLRRVLYPALERLRLPRVTWHQFRHSCATYLIEEGVPIEVVSEILGHANTAITQRIYDKAHRGKHRLAADAVEAALGDRLHDRLH